MKPFESAADPEPHGQGASTTGSPHGCPLSRSRGLAAALCALAFGAFTGRAASPLPQPIPGWRVELVAEAPKIKHPSVVACAPDGRVFVAEDPMDISLPKADATEGRILCFYSDGHATVFAEGLHAVFGLQYLEGKVYVLHNPNFSVFEDDNGVGRNRRELIERTLAEPWALNWNDHVPANFHLAMDGYFYAASGDKGLYGAKGTDGSKATLSSGGIFRIRPDGSKIEVMAHGVRNILDVALNAEDEQFTYDNTDEHAWMGRFTHMVEAGFYGYPHDFLPQRPYTLWMMEDYGPGAACGAFANTEDGLPPEFQGNVFLSDFGKRQVMRVRVEREGGTYRAVAKQDLFPNPPGDFRPVGIAPGADGLSIYICDWQYRDEKAEVSVGRLLKLSWTGRDHGSPKPSWYVPAATGRPFEATNGELARGLSHPSRGVRMTAQRRLAERKGTRDFATVLRDKSAPAMARAHAIWGLDAIDEGRAARKEITAATGDAEPTVRRQAIRQLGLRRTTSALGALLKDLKDGDASVRFQAETALGRIGEAKAVPALLPALEERDLFARYSAFTALNRIGTNTPSAWPEIVRGLESPNPRVAEGARFALRETYDPALLAALTRLFRDREKPAGARAAALDLIAALHRQRPEWKGEWGAYHPALQPTPAKTVAWAGTEAVLAALREGLGERDPNLRRASIQALASVHDTNSATALREVFPRETDAASRAAILRALGAMGDPSALDLATAELRKPEHAETAAAAIAAAEAIGGEKAIKGLAALLAAPGAGAEELAQAIAALGNLKAQSAAGAIETLGRHRSASVRAASLDALGRLRGNAAAPTLEAGLADAAPEVRRAAVRALDELKSTNAVPALLKAYADETLRPAALAALSRAPDERALDALLDGLSSKNPAERNAAHLAVREISGKALKALEPRAGSLSPQALTELRQIYAGNKKAEAGPLFAAELKPITREEYMEAAVKLPGDPSRGRRLFAEPGGLNCAACHRVAGQGNDVGPDLSAAGAQFDRRALAEAVLYPSKTVREGYQQIAIVMADGDEASGIVKGETAETLTLRDSAGMERKLPRASIKSRTNSAISLMPEGLQSALSPEEFADLIAYLASLKGKP